MLFPVGLFGGAGAAPAGWTPLDLGAKVLVYVDTKASSITQSGGTASQINNLVSGPHMVQATPGNQPAYNATGFGAGKPSLDFDGADDLMLATGISLGGTTCAAAMIGILSTGGPDWVSLASLSDSAGAAPLTFFQQDSNTTTLFTQRNNATLSTRTFSFDTRFRAMSQFNGTNNVLRLDGADGSAVANTTAFDATVSLSMGARTNAGQPAKCKMGVLLLLNAPMTSGEKTSWDTWATAW
jgi:hypothetical protein